MTCGILLVVFGKNYDSLAAHTVAYSRQFTNLPIHVLTNIKDRNSKWYDMENITFDIFNLNQNENRKIKTNMIKYTPFEKTLYIDCDSVIQKTGIENAFNLLEDNYLALNRFLYWGKGEKILRLYKRVMKRTNVSLPLIVYNGGIMCFKKNKEMKAFFVLWDKIWEADGKGREMPALACAVAKSRIPISLFPRNFFVPDIRNVDGVVQHNYNSYQGKNFHKEFGLPRIRENKPFDNDPKDWNWVNF